MTDYEIIGRITVVLGAVALLLAFVALLLRVSWRLIIEIQGWPRIRKALRLLRKTETHEGEKP